MKAPTPDAVFDALSGEPFRPFVLRANGRSVRVSDPARATVNIVRVRVESDAGESVDFAFADLREMEWAFGPPRGPRVRTFAAATVPSIVFLTGLLSVWVASEWFRLSPTWALWGIISAAVAGAAIGLALLPPVRRSLWWRASAAVFFAASQLAGFAAVFWAFGRMTRW